jgi:hypothetical protein
MSKKNVVKIDFTNARKPSTPVSEQLTLEDLADERRWVAWRYTRDLNDPVKARKKPPLSPHTGGLASATDPSTWGTAAEADQLGSELGIMLGKLNSGDYLIGIDIDDCRSAGKLASWAQEIITLFNSRTEVSPSGTGVKIFLRCTEKTVAAIRAQASIRSSRIWKCEAGAIELHLEKRYFTVTHRWKVLGSSPELAMVDAEKLLELITDIGPRFRGVPRRLPSATHAQEWPEDRNGASFPAKLRNQLDERIAEGDRSERFFALVGDLAKLGHGMKQIEHLLSGKPVAARFEEEGRLRQQIQECIGKKIAAGELQIPLTKRSARMPTSFTSAELARMQLPEQKHVVAGLFPIGLSILAGPKKGGKSFLMFKAAEAISLGERFLTFETDPGDVLMLALEDSAASLQTRYRQMRLTGSDRLHIRTEWPRGEEGVEKLIEWIDHTGDPRAVIIDTLGRFQGTPGRNGDAYQRDTAFLDPLQSAALDRNVAVIVITHKSKAGKSDDWVDNVLGSGGITGVADTLILLDRERNKPEAVLRTTSRSTRGLEVAVEFSDKSGTWERSNKLTAEVGLPVDQQRTLEALRERDEGWRLTELHRRLEKSASATANLLAKLESRSLAAKGDDGRWRAHRDD